ncbi:MAG: folate-binding protein YgfZ [Gemmatimonadota bacterium]|nr:MAG: folate-binding protein YgfZ [Gemmatimonadota bacterium]
MSSESELLDLLWDRPEPEDWRAEYSALVSTCALVARSDRAFVTVSGERCAEMLNGLLTQRVTNLSDTGRHALLLTAKGRVLTDMRVLPRAEHLLLDLPREGLENLLEALKKYLPPLYATFENVGDGLRQLGVYGPGATAAVRDAVGTIPPDGHLAITEVDIDGRPTVIVRDERLLVGGLEFITRKADARSLAARLLEAVTRHEGRAAGLRALEVVRVESGVPRYGADISQENLVQETGLERDAVSYDKGCYLGQEVVARVHFRGHVNRHLRGLRFAGDLPSIGARLFAEGREVGVVTSAAFSPYMGPIGLGYVRREIETPASLRWSDGPREGAVIVDSLPLRTAV